jgi:aryl-alcohol dehydrogenase-like predicted oxidoreductase
VRDGKVRYTGVSNFSGWQVAKTATLAREAEYEIIPAAVDSGMGSMIWGPLGESLLTGKVRRGRPVPPTTRQGTDWPEPFVTDRERASDVIDELVAVAEGKGVSAARVALAWLLQRPGVTGIVFGARNEEQLRDDLGALDVELSRDELARIDAVGQPAAQYPFWHRAMLATDRSDPAEAPYLPAYEAAVAAAA